MTRLLAGLLLALISTGTCRATIVNERDLEELFASSSTILYGYVKSAVPAKYGGRNEISGLFVVRVRDVAKGEIKGRDVKVCVQANLLLSGEYIFAGEVHGKNELVAGPDAVIMFSVGQFYRVISDDPVRRTPEGDVFAVAKRVPDFVARFRDLFGSVDFR